MEKDVVAAKKCSQILTKLKVEKNYFEICVKPGKKCFPNNNRVN